MPIQIQSSSLVKQAWQLIKTMPEQKALTFLAEQEERSYSVRQFFDLAAHHALFLRERGVQAGDLCVLVLRHDERVLSLFCGALLIGAVPSIFPFLSDKLDPERYFTSVRHMVEHSGAKLVLSYEEVAQPLRDVLQGLDVQVFNIDAEPAFAFDASVQDATALWAEIEHATYDADTVAFLQHSSGSTGLQKGVMLPHRAVINQLNDYSTALDLQRTDVIASWLPLYHDMGLITGFLMPILFGVHLVLMSPFQWVRDPKILLHAITRHRATLCWLPNFAYGFLGTRIPDHALDGVDLSSMRAFINCSEPVYAESQRIFRERFIPYGLLENALTVCYAMAENTFAVTQSADEKVDVVERTALLEAGRAIPVSEPATPSREFVSCGAPIPNCSVRIMDEQRVQLDERQVGEVAIQGNSLFSGYFNQTELSQQVLVDGWFYSGDMGYIADGELYITGRKKDLIIVAGKNIYPQDVENLLHNITGIHAGRIASFGVPNESLGTEEVAIVAEVDDISYRDDPHKRGAILREVRGRVVQNLDVVARYVQLVPTKWLVKTSSGKVARTANREKFIREFVEKV